MENSQEVVDLLVETMKSVLGGPSVPEALEAFEKHISKSVVVTQNGITRDYDSWYAFIKENKPKMPNVDVRQRKIVVSSRSVGVFQYGYMKEAGIWMDCILLADFGEVGSEDEKKVIKCWEVVEIGPRDRNPDAEEFKSLY